VLFYLHHLSDLGKLLFPFNVFQYALFRAAMAAITGFLISVVFGKWFIGYLRRRKALERTEKGDSARLVEIHLSKKDTPTMGGIILLLALLTSTLLWARPDRTFTWLLIGFSLALGLVGFVDDYVKLTHAKKKGISARTKFIAQLAIGVAAGLILYSFPLMPADPEGSRAVFFPFFKTLSLPLGVFHILLVVLVTSGSSNAVNLTDGLDGLAIGCAVMVGMTFAVIGFPVGDLQLSNYLYIPHVPDAVEASIFASALVGAGLGFLWFNCHPAQIFMGDTGALPLGGCLGLLAVILKQEVLLLVVGGVFVAEAMSVILQVASFKLRGKRIFLIAPLHHHYQFKGWAETKVTVRFWIVSAILSLFSLVTLKIR
jgi:phospho-N-acetylmuramoyl-pentapeptide-transferase